MTRLIGEHAICSKVIEAPQIGSDHPAHRTNLVYTGGNSNDGDEVFQTKNSFGAKTHRLLQSGVMYAQAIEPMVATSKIGAGVPFDDIRSKKITWDDGTFQTTAAAGGVTPGMALDSVTVIPNGSLFQTGDLFVAGAVGEVGRWKIICNNLLCDNNVGLNFFFQRAGGAQLDGEVTGIDYGVPTLLTQGPVTFPGAPIQLQEVADSVSPGNHMQLEVDVWQKAGDFGCATTRLGYISDTGRARTATRNFTTIPAQDMAGFYIRGTGASNFQGTVYVYKYSSV